MKRRNLGTGIGTERVIYKSRKKAWKRLSHSPQKEPKALILDFKPPTLWNDKLLFLKPPSLWYLLEQLWKSNADSYSAFKLEHMGTIPWAVLSRSKGAEPAERMVMTQDDGLALRHLSSLWVERSRWPLGSEGGGGPAGLEFQIRSHHM